MSDHKENAVPSRHAHRERFTLDVHGETIVADLHTPDGVPTDVLAVMVHGGPGGKKEGPADLFIEVAEALAKEGISSVLFDFLGAGESGGRYRDMTIRRQAEELTAVIDAAVERVKPARLAVVGESYGATSALLTLRQEWSALVLLWPCVYLRDNAFESYVTPEKMAVAERDGFIVEDGEEVGVEFLRQVREIDHVDGSLRGSSVPVLFVHGDSDQEVPLSQSVHAAELTAGPKKVVVVEGGDHCLEQPHERRVVLDEVSSWLREFLVG